MSDLVKKETGLQQIQSDFWGEMSSADFKIPRMSIGQPTTKAATGKSGHFNFSSGKSVELLTNVKLILPKKTRVLYAGNNRARCKSDNYYQPSKFVPNPISSNCLTCPAAQWGEDNQKAEIAAEVGAKDVNKPLCTETYNLFMADEQWMPFWANFQKTQLKIVGEQLFTRLRYEYGHVPPYGVAFNMSLKKIESGMQNYFNVVFSDFRVLEDYGPGKTLYNMYSQRAQEMLAQEHEQMDKAHDKEKEAIPVFDQDEPIPF